MKDDLIRSNWLWEIHPLGSIPIAPIRPIAVGTKKNPGKPGVGKCPKYPLEYAKAVIQYLQQAQISFDSGPQASKIPWTLVFLDFALQFPSVIQTSSNLHTLVCQFRARVVRLCKVLSISVQPYRYCYLLDQFNLGRLSGFVGSFSPVDSPRLWFLLVDSSFQVSTSVRVKQDVFLHLDSALNIPLG